MMSSFAKNEVVTLLFFRFFQSEVIVKLYSTLNITAQLVALIALIFGLSGGVHAQASMSGGDVPASQSKSAKVPKQPCAGPSAITCPGGMKCIDDPSDKCDPTKDGINCMGICVAGAPASKVKQPCGGPSGIVCPGGMICVDDTTDTCDPTKDGVNCIGLCINRQ
ncbi:hypothetical protein EBAPG3_010830 [Nitrosospira lacus]|uniref:Kazal-like domain-containing protein n=1 Tax=Nitrosospira lacus TaxID=1288494 RepID=A0A1W6SR13_9PROT|nr:hypothetical protein EBAPG3_010830 [Nitrosospira lacus]